MNTNIFKKIPIALAVAAFASVQAASDMDTRVKQLEEQMSQVRTGNPMGTYGANNASANPQVHGTDFYIDLSVLYEQPRVAGSEYSYTDDNTTAGDTPLRGSIKEVRPDWTFGVQVGVGMDTYHDGWRVGVEYSHLDSNGSSSASGGLNGNVVALRGTPNLFSSGGTDFTNCTQAKANISFDYNSVALAASRGMFLSETLSFTPFAGLNTSWVKIKENVSYTGGDILDVNSIYVNDSSKFWGLGPVGGFNGKLYLGAGFAIFGDFSAALLYGNFDVNHYEYYSANEANNNIKLDGDLHRFVPELAMALGLSYDTYLDNNKHHINISLGYDATYMFRVNQMIKLDDNATYRYDRYSEDASMSGVKLQARWDF